MPQNNENHATPVTRPRLGRTRVVGLAPGQPSAYPSSITGELPAEATGENSDAQTTPSRKLPLLSGKLPLLSGKKAPQSGDWNYLTEERGDQSTAHLMQLSGMMRSLREPGRSSITPLPALMEEEDEDGYWPLGIQQAGPLPILNVYGREPFGRTLPPFVPVVIAGAGTREEQQPAWRKNLDSPLFKISLGLLVGVLLLVLASRFVNVSQVLQILSTHLLTVQGIGSLLLFGVVYLVARSLRGLRWKLFLDSEGQVSAVKVIRLCQLATFFNFLLPVCSGEAVKSLALKRIAAMPISKSLPTVAMDKALDFLAPLIIVVLVPVLGLSMNLPLWLLFGLAALLLASLFVLIGLVVWRRPFALGVLCKMLSLFPGVPGTRIESFATGLVDALLAGAKRPKIFLLALLLTALAAFCDGLCVLLAFGAIGFPLALGSALLGYALCCVCTLVPAPPGQVGGGEIVGLLVFSALLHLPGNDVLAVCIFAHLWLALLLTIVGFVCLATLGLTFVNALRVPGEVTKEAKATN